MADVDIPRPCHRAQLALAGLVVASADVEAVASEEETEEASEEASTGPGAAGVSAVVVATEGSAVRMAMAGHPPHRVDLATAEVDMAAVLTVVVTVVVIAVTAVTAETTVAVVATEDATTTSSAAAAAAVVVIVAPTVAPPEATPSRSVHDTAAAPAAPPAVGTATETTAATTPASDHTREAQVTKANANFDDTDNKTTAGLVVGILSPLISLFTPRLHISFPFDNEGKQREGSKYFLTSTSSHGTTYGTKVKPTKPTMKDTNKFSRPLGGTFNPNESTQEELYRVWHAA